MENCVQFVLHRTFRFLLGYNLVDGILEANLLPSVRPFIVQAKYMYTHTHLIQSKIDYRHLGKKVTLSRGCVKSKETLPCRIDKFLHYTFYMIFYSCLLLLPRPHNSH